MTRSWWLKPYIYEDLDTSEPAFPVERNWQLFRPSRKQEGEARSTYRAALWVDRRHAAQQIAVPSSDVLAARIPTKHGAALILSAYDVKSTDGQAASEEQLRAMFVCLFVLIYQAICGIRDACDSRWQSNLRGGRNGRDDKLSSETRLPDVHPYRIVHLLPHLVLLLGCELARIPGSTLSSS